MAVYKVVRAFTEAASGTEYKVGDEYPADAPAGRLALLQEHIIAGFEGPFIAAVEVIPNAPTENNSVAEIKAYLTANGVEFPAKATKPELLDLVEGE